MKFRKGQKEKANGKCTASYITTMSLHQGVQDDSGGEGESGIPSSSEAGIPP